MNTNTIRVVLMIAVLGFATASKSFASTCMSNQFSSPNPGSYSNELAAVGGIASTDVWAVGSYDFPPYNFPHTLTEHWDGSVWSYVQSPNFDLRDYDNKLNGVAAITSTNVWSVGSLYRRNRPIGFQPLALHWNGSRWNIATMPSGGGYLGAISAVRQNHNAWAAGGTVTPYGPFVPQQPLIELWNGSTWSISPSPTLPYGGSLSGISSPSNISAWAVGTSLDASQRYVPLTEHWNGSAWSQIPAPLVGNDAELLSVSAVFDRDAWATGYYYDATSDTFPPLVEHWNGSTWQVVTIPTPTDSALYGVSTLSKSNVWEVGNYGQPGQPLLMHWDGVQWSQVTGPSLTGVVLTAVAAFPGSVWSVGSGAGLTLIVLSHC